MLSKNKNKNKIKIIIIIKITIIIIIELMGTLINKMHMLSSEVFFWIYVSLNSSTIYINYSRK